MAFALLLESGDQLLLESGDVILLEEDVTVVEATYVFTPPTESRIVEIGKRFRFTQEEGKTVLLNGSTYTAQFSPTVAELNAADTYYLGGHEHPVTEATKTAIEASGVGGTFTVAP